MTAPIVGLIGRKRAGKDSFAGRLVAEHGYTRLAFADNVRQAALDLDPIIHWSEREGSIRLSQAVSELGWEAAKDIPEVRRTLQRFGSETVRKLDPDFWVRPVMEEARRLSYQGVPVVITDVRFFNEAADILGELGGLLIRIVRPGSSTDDVHASEVELDNQRTHRIVVNDRGIERLHRQADLIALSIKVVGHPFRGLYF